jgi:hypothetical protein
MFWVGNGTICWNPLFVGPEYQGKHPKHCHPTESHRSPQVFKSLKYDKAMLFAPSSQLDITTTNHKKSPEVLFFVIYITIIVFAVIRATWTGYMGFAIGETVRSGIHNPAIITQRGL